MSAPDAKLLIVCNPDRRDEIEALLSDAGYVSVEFDSGAGATVSSFETTEPDVVIVDAELDPGDPRAVVASLREASPGVAIVLLGQQAGPIHNALDASDFEVDHFIGRPIAAKALLYAVRTGTALTRTRATQEPALALVEGPAQETRLTEDVISHRAQTQTRIGAAMDEAIDAFLDEAIAALPSSLEGSDEDDDEATGEREGVPVAAPDQPTGKMVDASELFRISTADVVGDEDTAPADWREETVVLGKDSGPAPAHAPGRGAKELGDDEAPAGGTFARELRRKMSMMAERLFPGEERSMDLRMTHGAHTEIDLSSLGGGQTVVPLEDDDELSDAFLDAEETHVPDWSDGGTQPRIRSDAAVTEAKGAIDDAGNDVASILSRLFELGVTGRVTFSSRGTEKVVYLDRGKPVFATSNLPHDRMGDLLYREGKLTRAQHIASRELVAGSGKRMGEILVAEGFLKPKELMPAVRRHLEDLVYSLFAWTEGTFEIVEDVLPSSEKIRLTQHPAALTLEGIRRKYDLPRLLGLFRSPDPVLDVPEPARVRALSRQLELLPSEDRAIQLFDGHRTASRVADVANADLLTVTQVGFALVALGAAEIVGHTVADHEITVEAPLTAGEDDVEIDRERIEAKFELVKEGDYFRFLGVRRDCSAFEIRRAYEQAVADFEPTCFADEVRRDLQRELEEIRLVLGEAYAVLSNDEIRASYLAHLRD